MTATTHSPQSIRDVEHLEDLLSVPTEGVVETVRRLEGDYIVLGVGGKMGPTLARMLRRAADLAGVKRRIIGVSRFSSPELPALLQQHRIEAISCDLLDQDALDRLPEVPNVMFMAGMKFGSTGQQARTWAMNTYLSGMVSRKFSQSRIVAFSTGNVYPMVPVHTGGCAETHEPKPEGEYAMSCLGRERIFEHFSRSLKIPMALIRLNYAVEMRYGVLLDLAHRVHRNEPIDLTMGNLNAIWQADANAAAIRAFEHVASPPLVLNLTGPETLSIRTLCEELGRHLGKQPTFLGSESPSAYLNNAALCHDLFGYPTVGIRQLLAWTADWVNRGGDTLGKPTHFETRDGKF
ncbi:MAG TPA: NAD-dependent epimerase/dehydratase family protein [Tepidisphaeraceae bacterium]|jgi:nucleoside-diphosphate-sugar epimerase|nr:NAD-dependent epimerase/dehydratase family protein [Tepidisphaeraceae bacterium]